MNYKKMVTSLTTATILLTSLTGTGLTLFTDQVSAATSDAEEKAYQDKARQEVNALFTDNNPSSNAIKGPTNQDAIDGAQRWVNTIVNLTVKASLQADVDKAQGLLNAKLAEE
ncbi:toxin Cry1Ac domain D-VI-related protein, partial [Carnobacterium maltaromaticum]|uniref:toxin Cry1Ac domain D-VI-related protein n=1 Tax=Carnobacterium maltaromaticum TaxID=2751 RepID=UPI00295E3182